LLIEEQRTNSIRNNTMVGAVAGTPGTLPTNWTGGTTTQGVSREIIGTGTENGINYIDIKISGITTGTLFFTVRLEGLAVVAAANGQTWTHSAYVKIVGGTLANAKILFGMAGNNSSSVSVEFPSNLTLTPTNASLISQRVVNTGTFANASVAFVQPYIQINATTGVAIDLTLRIGLPQLEQGAFATSPIPTTTTALTRALDVAVMTGTNFSSWYNQSEGTVSVAFDVYAPSVSDGFGRVYQINDGTSNNIIALLKNNGLGLEYFGLVRVAGLEQATLFTPAILANIPAKVATAYKLNDFAQSTNGGSVTTDTSGTIPTVTQMRIGSGTDVSVLNGHLRRITYFNRRLANSELQLLSS
jgi:hypothetical protein